MTKKIYVASSWRNMGQPYTVYELRHVGYEVYDFRNPAPGNTGFQWSQIDAGWADWSRWSFRNALATPIAEGGFKFDKDAMDWADSCLLLLPSGKSAHLEAGYMAGAGKKVVVYQGPNTDKVEPELMYKLLGKFCITWEEVLEELAR